MSLQNALRCKNCQGLDVVRVGDDSSTCRHCGSTETEAVELPPKPSRKRHADAYRRRAGMVGELLSCICTYPLDQDETTVSGHDKRCPSEAIAKRHIELEELREAREQAAVDEDRPPWER